MNQHQPPADHPDAAATPDPDIDATPTEQEHEFRVEVHVLKDGELIGKIGRTESSTEGFASVADRLSESLTDSWSKVLGMTGIIDSTYVEPKPKVEPTPVVEPDVQKGDLYPHATKQNPWWRRWLNRPSPQGRQEE